MKFHNPVLLNECIQGLSIKPKGTYVDVTFGGGGHSRLILSKLDGGKLFAFDQDHITINNDLKHPNFKLINSNFRYLKNFLEMEEVTKIDGLLADLGVSSYQFDVPERGFSTRHEGRLDMRMYENSTLSADDVINEYSEDDLANLLYRYGELRNSRKIAKNIVIARNNSRLNTTTDLKSVIVGLAPERYRNQFLARVFQAIRIEVNDEISALEEMLLSAVELLNPAGRLVVISYHSLEDRLVKNIMKKGSLSGILQKDFFGNPLKTLKEINRKVIVPSQYEIKENSRARSAKLRIGEKIYD
ncbi:MAG: 16S rRNA (cytosine(1402)-N(4))-methyltransferase [Flavobacteriales bacterium]|nr:16S rRNA (cytosine(1402)-N(4))-methyltransferase [Flavobacteriales bacterium]|tara:strand:- start:1963 stop:2865 length:903 start_codon:yes stop_codon:yes gene_type:complete